MGGRLTGVMVCRRGNELKIDSVGDGHDSRVLPRNMLVVFGEVVVATEPVGGSAKAATTGVWCPEVEVEGQRLDGGVAKGVSGVMVG